MTPDLNRLQHLHAILARIASGERADLDPSDEALTLGQVRDEIDDIARRIDANRLVPVPHVDIRLPFLGDA